MNNSPILQSLSSFDYKSWRETFITAILRITCVLGVVIITVSYPTATPVDLVLFITLYIILLAVTLARLKYTVRAFALLAMVFTIGVNSILAWGPWLDGSIFFITFILLSALLFDQRVDLVALAISILTFVLIATLHQLEIYQLTAEGAPNTVFIDWAAYTINFSIASVILIIAIHQLKKEFVRVTRDTQSAFETLVTERKQLENTVRERTDELEARAMQLRSSASISRTIAEMRDISKLMEKVTSLTSEQFGSYHVGLYLLDERKRNAFLQASSSADGKRLIGQGIRIEPDRLNLIHRVIESKHSYITSDVDTASFVRDVNFPLTRSRMLLPLIVRNNVIGILDMHADQPHFFDMQDAEALQTLADLVAISIDNAHLINETRNLLRQLDTYTSVQTHETWSKFTSRHKPAYQYTPAGVRPIFAGGKKDEKEGLRIPLILHGQTIGALTLKKKGTATAWSEREHILVEKVADQVALALENSRLVDETQKRAMRDQVIANISARVRETLNVESVLQTAATELRKVFDLKEAEISIGSLQEEISPSRRNTGSLRPK